MNNDFKDQSNYLVAFLAATVGLFVFKEGLIRNRFLLFGLHISYFEIMIPLLATVLLATYIGALAYLAGNITFTSYPIRKWLTIASSTVAGIGLIYPIVFVVLLLFSWIFHSIKLGSTATPILSILISVAASLGAGMISYLFARDKEVDDIQQQVIQILDDQVKISANDSRYEAPLEYKFLRKYEETVELGVKYLKVMGYGISGRGLSSVARALNKREVLSSDDVKIATSLNKMRNEYAHGKDHPSGHELDDAISKLDNLYKKIQIAF